MEGASLFLHLKLITPACHNEDSDDDDNDFEEDTLFIF